ncbi:MAG: Ni/Fe hydrogenase subunit gamma [Candidatus Zixiibacteriota bacterium]|nr:MAG: Ni/Fe hydrogenase subunit gamma [candidate division Zixibacteria bacterium]
MEHVLDSKATHGEAILTPMVPEIFRVEKFRKETHDTFTLELKPTNRTGEHRFGAGQFNMLYKFGVGEAAISISGDPTSPNPLIHTIRAVGTVTKAVSKLKAGDTIGVRGPFGSCWPVEAAKSNDVLIIAGGIGLAPLRPVIYQVLAERRKYGKVYLLYGTRTPEDMLYRTELEKWRARFDMEVLVTVDRASSEWHGNVGVVTTLLKKLVLDPDDTIAMICGPEIMMRFVAMDLIKKEFGLDRIHVSMERNMKCGIGLCGHCQYGPTFICKDGPVYTYDRVIELLARREI